MNYTKPFSAIFSTAPVAKLTVADAVSALQDTLTKLGQVVSTRDASVTEKNAEIQTLQTQIDEDRAESVRAKAIQAKLEALLA